MEARFVPRKMIALLTGCFLFICLTQSASAQRMIRKQRGQGVATDNFVVYAADPALAGEIARKAEIFRKELAIEWLGHELPRWQQRCPIKVEVAMQAGGETSFAFIMNQSGSGMPVDWDMRIFGPPDRLLDAVLPHEVTHTIFATHFGRPLPRWADEGACTTVEHISERKKNHQMLIEFLTSRPSRGIPFNRMFVMRDYPRDILPLYAQGYSLARYLIMLKGRRHFIDYVGAGMNREQSGQQIAAWDQTTKEFYGFQDLSDLQVKWIKWVKDGSPDVESGSNGVEVVSAGEPATFASAPVPVEQSALNRAAPGQLASSQLASSQPTADQPLGRAPTFPSGAPLSNPPGQLAATLVDPTAPSPAFGPPQSSGFENSEPVSTSNGGWYESQRTQQDERNRIEARHGGYSNDTGAATGSAIIEPAFTQPAITEPGLNDRAFNQRAPIQPGEPPVFRDVQMPQRFEMPQQTEIPKQTEMPQRTDMPHHIEMSTSENENIWR